MDLHEQTDMELENAHRNSPRTPPPPNQISLCKQLKFNTAQLAKMETFRKCKQACVEALRNMPDHYSEEPFYARALSELQEIEETMALANDTNDDEGFETWTKEEELRTKSLFVKNSGIRKAKNRQFTYYICNRSGFAKLKSERKRHEKIEGFVKCGKTCPAFMNAIREQKEEAIKITVEYQSVHAGHEMQAGKLRLHQEDRRNLEALLKVGVPSTKIIENIQAKCPPTERLGLLTRKDLYNVCQSFKVDESVLHAEDAVSIDLQVLKMQRDSYDPVLLYKPLGSSLTSNPLIQKQDFILGIVNEAQLELLELYGKNIIMMDSTHGTNQYGYLLTTIMVSEDNHEGLPIAVCYSNRVSSNVLEPFFEEIKIRLPHLRPKVFMSDDDPAFYNAWRRVFREVEFILLCSWRVSRSWNRNLNGKIKNIELKKEMSDKLKQLVNEIHVVTFERMYEDFVQKYTKNEEAKNFITYFEKIYGGRKQKWAYCYRVGCGINTNMKLERWHQELKYEEGGGRVLRRLDKSLSLVLNAVSKKLMGRIISIERGKLTSKISTIRIRHLKSCKEMQGYSAEEFTPTKWVVFKTVANRITTYEINKAKDCDYPIRCHICKICIHSFTCNCVDYSIKFTICKHIHYICQKFPTKLENLRDETMLIIDEDSNRLRREKEMEAILKEKEKPIVHEKPVESVYERVKRNLRYIYILQ
ncbi:uncharacterized protein TNCT_342451 [Trichonephila clavata]|uniref:MULE transposase domain-containing protein n=1 Tax=Trichonephila clavata TaxID=2740835 RepID=A0A8X6H4P4_TRICU|nr:uncharacterized protein TNCT_342451 [Trichonephila clavata]